MIFRFPNIKYTGVDFSSRISVTQHISQTETTNLFPRRCIYNFILKVILVIDDIEYILFVKDSKDYIT